MRFGVAPGGKRVSDDAHSGILRLHIPADGSWRIAASTPVWIDVIGQKGIVASVSHGRLAPCTSLRKVVEFPLSAGDYTLQLSGNPGPGLRLMVSQRP